MDVDAVKQAVSTSAGFLGLRQTRAYLRTESVQRQLAHSGALSLEDWLAGGHDLLGREPATSWPRRSQPPAGLDAAVVAASADTLGETAEHMGVEPPDLHSVLDRCRGLSEVAAG